MTDFDPYLKWLGIREPNRPINHYRLLGLDLFECDLEVISMAADRQMTHIRTYQNGPNGDLSQQILNELARARRCLLESEKKAEYDSQLRSTLRHPAAPVILPRPSDLTPPPIARAVESFEVEPAPIPSVHPAVVASAAYPAADSVRAESGGIEIRPDHNARKQSKRRERKQLLWGLFGWVSGGVAAVGVAAALIGSGLIGNFQFNPSDELVEDVNQSPDVAVPDSSVVVESNPNPRSRPTAKNPSTNKIKPENSLAGKPNSVIGTLKSTDPKTPASALFQPDPELNRYDLSNLFGTYPRANPVDFGIFGQVKRGLRNKKTVMLEPSALPDPVGFRLVSEETGILIGLAAKTDKDNKVTLVRPIFHDGFHAILGGEIGKEFEKASGEDAYVSVAKPGYAVGEIQISAVKPLNCFRVRYMRISGESLDPNVSYFGDWIGRETGPRRTIQNKKGLPIVGLYGSLAASHGLSTVSLIAMDPDAQPESTAASVKNLNPNAGFLNSIVPADDSDPFSNAAVNSTQPGKMVKVAEPNGRERAAARKKIPGSIKILFQDSRTPQALIFASERLLNFARSETESNLKYVMLEEAELKGIAAGDAQTAVDAVRAMDETFEIDFWKRVLKTIEKAAGNTSMLTAFNFKITIDELIEESREKALYNSTDELLSVAIKLARRAKEFELVDEYEKQEKEIKFLADLTRESAEAVAILAGDPGDTKANLNQGDFLFVQMDDLDAALKHWLQSADTQLIEISKLELQFDTLDGTQKLELADLWRELVDNKTTPINHKRLTRARGIYQEAARSFSGAKRELVNEKLNEVHERLREY